ncbi:hypothetical protein GS682_19080 [Nostoc sp. B(2019)]|nr:hypothetical protein [Nostoc sp. B(2019)]
MPEVNGSRGYTHIVLPKAQPLTHTSRTSMILSPALLCNQPPSSGIFTLVGSAGIRRGFNS